jgi:ketosteroid isomerase-like protein
MDLSQVATQQATVLRIRDGKVVRLALYWDCDRALADLGLEA